MNADFEQNYIGGVYVDKVGVKPRLGFRFRSRVRIRFRVRGLGLVGLGLGLGLGRHVRERRF